MFHRSGGGAPRRRIRTAALVAASVTLAGTGIAAYANADTSTCPTDGIKFTTSLTNGTMKVGSLTSSTGNSATACGTSNGVTATVPQSNISFAPGTVKVSFLSFPATISAMSDISGPVTLVNGLSAVDVSLTGKVKVTADVLGAKCDIGPFDLTLTSGKSGTLQGATLTDDGTGTLKGKLVSGDAALPKIATTSSCNAFIAGLSNLLIGLPASSGKTLISYDAALKLG